MPGPGTYRPVDALNRTGSYLLSSRRNSRCRLFDREPRYNAKDIDRVPGPGMYFQACQLHPTGQYSLSKHRGSRAPRFSRALRRSAFDGTGWNCFTRRGWG